MCLLLTLLALLLGCTDDPMPVIHTPRWQCPAQWVAHAQGGCGPAVILCRPDGGAVQRACEGLDLTHPHPIADGDGGVGATFYWLPDGGIGGAWPEELPDLNPAAGVGVPAADWSPDAGIPSCPAPWRRLPGGTCEPVFSDNCTSEQEYPDLGTLPAGARVLHVHLNSRSAVPTGSIEEPFPSLTRALQAVAGETWIRIAAGTYQENLSLRGRVHIAGCRHRVILEGIGTNQPTIMSSQSGTNTDLSGMTIRGASFGVAVRNGVRFSLRDVDLEDNHEAALIAQGTGARIDIEGCTVRSTHARSSDNTRGYGVFALEGGAVRAVRSLIEANQDRGVFSASVNSSDIQSQVELIDCIVRGTLSSTATQESGHGIDAFQGGTISATRTAIQANHEVGAAAIGASPSGVLARMELTDCVVEDSAPRSSDGLGGFGISASLGGQVIATRTRIERNHESGVFSTAATSSGTSSRIDLVDCSVIASLSRPNSRLGGNGLYAYLGGTIVASGTLVEDNREAGVLAKVTSSAGQPSHVDLNRCVVRGTLPRELDQSFGFGLDAEGGASITAIDTLVVRNRHAGVSATGSDDRGMPSRIELSGCTVTDTQPRASDLAVGYGVTADRGAVIAAANTLIQRNHTLGVGAHQVGVGGTPSTVDLVDCVIRDTRSRQSDHQWGHGLNTELGGVITASRTVIQGNRGFGVVSDAPSLEHLPSRIALTDCVVADTLSVEADRLAGYGVAAQQGGQVDVTRTLFRRNHGVSVFSHATDDMNAPSRVNMVDCVVDDTLPLESDVGAGYGIQAQLGAEVFAARTLINSSREIGVLSVGRSAAGLPASVVQLTDCAVRHTLMRTAPPIGGIGLLAQMGGRLNAARIVLASNIEAGAMVSGQESVMRVDDAIITDNEPTLMRGGFGVSISAGASAEFHRLAILRSSGLALAAVPDNIIIGSAGGSRLDVYDAFIQRVELSAVEYDACNPTSSGSPRAYGAYVGASSVLNLERVVMRDGLTAAAAFGGQLRWTDGLVAGFARLFVRGSSVGTPPIMFSNVSILDAAVPTVQDDPMLTTERLPEPTLDPQQHTLGCRSR